MKLNEDHTSIFKPKVPEYLLEKQRTITYLDYKWLGHQLEGAPDGTDEDKDLLLSSPV